MIATADTCVVMLRAIVVDQLSKQLKCDVHSIWLGWFIENEVHRWQSRLFPEHV
jgi:hypothetical protein